MKLSQVVRDLLCDCPALRDDDPALYEACVKRCIFIHKPAFFQDVKGENIMSISDIHSLLKFIDPSSVKRCRREIQRPNDPYAGEYKSEEQVEYARRKKEEDMRTQDGRAFWFDKIKYVIKNT